MIEAIEIEHIEQPLESWRQMIIDGVDSHNIAETGIAEYYPIDLFLTNSARDCLGGLLGVIWGGWLHIESLWVRDDLRGRGHATRLLAHAERYALEKGCLGAALETHSEHAKNLYEKLGYEVFGMIDNFPPGHDKFFLKKHLKWNVHCSRLNGQTQRPDHSTA